MPDKEQKPAVAADKAADAASIKEQGAASQITDEKDWDTATKAANEEPEKEDL